MIVGYGRERTTRDVDARIEYAKDEVLAAAEEIAEEENLDPNWLNENARLFMPPATDDRARTVLNTPGLADRKRWRTARAVSALTCQIEVIRGVADRPVRGLHLVLRGSRDMPFSDRIKPISYLKAHAAEIIRTLADQPEPLIVTQNGEAKAVVQDIDSYEQMQESMALLKMLALGNRQIDAGRVQPAAEVLARLRERHQAD